MKKLKTQIGKAGKYFREVSVVIIGVAVTLFASYLVGAQSEKNTMKRYLNTIKTELELNARNFDHYAVWLQKSVGYAEYLRVNDKKNLNRDSLNYYAVTSLDGGCGYMNTNSLTTQFFAANAFEMFKLSGIMSQLTDKELLMSIWQAYTYLEYAKQRIDDDFKMKEEEALKELELTAEGKSVDVPMRIYYSTDLPYSLVRTCEDASAIINETLARLKASKWVN